jgi:putative Mg2+ transporter-C (MgtC) family protein
MGVNVTWFSTAELEYLLRIVLAALCGGAVGFERERRLKSAGIRTHIIVALSAALMTVVSKYGFMDVLDLPGVSLDASRVAAGVATAIGFLGAGVIFVRKQSVSGVTTAAGLWATVGVGIAVGAGLYFTGVTATAVIVLVQVVLHHNTPLTKSQQAGIVVLSLPAGCDDPTQAYQELERMVDSVEGIEAIRQEDGGMRVRCDVVFPAHFTPEDILQQLRGCPAIQSLEMHLPS